MSFGVRFIPFRANNLSWHKGGNKPCTYYGMHALLCLNQALDTKQFVALKLTKHSLQNVDPHYVFYMPENNKIAEKRAYLNLAQF